jgi:hypothetical protein
LELSGDGARLAEYELDELWKREVERLNRRVLEALFPAHIAKMRRGPVAGHHAGMAVCERGLEVAGGTALAKTERTIAPVAVKNGTTVYLNLSPICYQLERDRVDGAKWRKLVGGLLKEVGLRPRALLKNKDGQTVNAMECIYRGNGPRTTLCVLANQLHTATISSFNVEVDDQPRTLTLVFDKPVKDLKNERTGKALGNGRKFKFEFKPWEASVFSFAAK